MIIAGWILAILGLAQVVFAGTIEVSQLPARESRGRSKSTL